MHLWWTIPRRARWRRHRSRDRHPRQRPGATGTPPRRLRHGRCGPGRPEWAQHRRRPRVRRREGWSDRPTTGSPSALPSDPRGTLVLDFDPPRPPPMCPPRPGATTWWPSAGPATTSRWPASPGRLADPRIRGVQGRVWTSFGRPAVARGVRPPSTRRLRGGHRRCRPRRRSRPGPGRQPRPVGPTFGNGGTVVADLSVEALMLATR